MDARPAPGLEAQFARNYEVMGEPELLTLGVAYDSLVEPAQDALRAEFARRHLEPPIVPDPPEPPSDRNVVILRRYRDLAEAIVSRSVLESAGISCFLRNENMIRLDWPLSNLLGGIALQVAVEDREEAEKLLSQPIPPAIQFGIESAGESEAESEYKQPHCPRCGSLDIVTETTGRKAALGALYFGVPLPLGRPYRACNTCESRWIDDAEDEATSPHPSGNEAKSAQLQEPGQDTE
jgi:hypothetical protein